MVTDNHFRWDFIGLSTDEKPTPATSSKVVDGSTFYCSDNSKLYVWCKTQWYEKTVSGGGGGTSYTAGEGIDITSDVISVDTTTIQPKLTAGSNITISDENVISASGGGSSYNTYSTKQTSSGNRGGAIYLGNLNASQEQFEDPSTADEHRRYFCVLPYDNSKKPGTNSILIGAEQTSNTYNNYIGFGFTASCEATGVINIGGHYGRGNNSIIIGSSANTSSNDDSGIAIGYSAGDANFGGTGSISLGAYSKATRQGEMNIGATNASYGFNNTNYRLISGVHDGQDIHDCATVAQGNVLSTSAPTTSTVGVLGQLYTDTTNMHTYQCTAISGDTYTWTQRW